MELKSDKFWTLFLLALTFGELVSSTLAKIGDATPSTSKSLLSSSNGIKDEKRARFLGLGFGSDFTVGFSKQIHGHGGGGIGIVPHFNPYLHQNQHIYPGHGHGHLYGGGGYGDYHHGHYSRPFGGYGYPHHHHNHGGYHFQQHYQHGGFSPYFGGGLGLTGFGVGGGGGGYSFHR